MKDQLVRAMTDAHGSVVHGRRVQAIARGIAELIEPGWSIGDVGCGDGRISSLVAASVPGVTVRGFEFAPRPNAVIPAQQFDGSHLPVEDGAFDCVTIVDVLHHTDDPMVLLAEAKRVARRAVVIKDHRTSRPLAIPTLRFMDWVGNRGHGVRLPYNYWSMEQWERAFAQLSLRKTSFRTGVGLYPFPANVAFEWGLHFLVRLDRA